MLTWLEGMDLWLSHGVIIGLIVANVALGITGYSIWFERKFAGRMQNRPGPTEVGPFGLFQPIADVAKLMSKEDIVPRAADKALFNLAPPLTVAAAVATLAVVPFAPGLIVADLHIGIFEHVIPGRRFKQGLCAGCGHPRTPDASAGFCSECGRRHEAPDGWRLEKRTVLNFVLWMMVGLFFGSAIGETRLTLDERRWTRECRMLEGMSSDSLGFRTRRRSWPSGYSELYYRTEQGPYAEPLITNERVARNR